MPELYEVLQFIGDVVSPKIPWRCSKSYIQYQGVTTRPQRSWSHSDSQNSYVGESKERKIAVGLNTTLGIFTVENLNKDENGGRS